MSAESTEQAKRTPRTHRAPRRAPSLALEVSPTPGSQAGRAEQGWGQETGGKAQAPDAALLGDRRSALAPCRHGPGPAPPQWVMGTAAGRRKPLAWGGAPGGGQPWRQGLLGTPCPSERPRPRCRAKATQAGPAAAPAQRPRSGRGHPGSLAAPSPCGAGAYQSLRASSAPTWSPGGPGDRPCPRGWVCAEPAPCPPVAPPGPASPPWGRASQCQATKEGPHGPLAPS